MSDIKNLLEKMDAMSAAERKPTGPKWPGYLKGTDSAKKIRSRMVGDGGAAESVEESESFLKELNQVINENPVRRDLFQEWSEFKEGFSDTVKSTADKIVAAGSATRDALGSVVDSIPRPFDAEEVAKDIKQRQMVQPVPKNDRRNTGKTEQTTGNNEGKETPTADNKDLKSKKSSSGSGVTTDSPSKYPTKTDIPKRELPKNTSAVIGERELSEQQVVEYGAPGSAIGNDTATNPAEVFAKGQERKASREQTAGQITGLVAQITGLRNQLADLNQQFPQGANPVEKAMSLQQMTAQRNGIKSQIVDLAKQISELRQQAI
jgi:hypothetical protein